MKSGKTLLSFAAVLLVLVAAFILLCPEREAFAASLYKAKISPGLATQLSAARSDEMVAAVVKLKAKPNLERIRGKRGLVSCLRRRTPVQYRLYPTELSRPCR